VKKVMGLFLILVLFALVIAGCGKGPDLHRIPGLTPDKVVATFHDLAKNQKYAEAALYVSPTSLASIKGVSSFLKNDLGLSDALNSNLLSVKVIGSSGDFAAVLATFQDGVNSTKFTMKAIGLEKINGEWYIVDNNTIYQNAKYKILQNLLSGIL
jgi:predicted small lipoprotein YifL